MATRRALLVIPAALAAMTIAGLVVAADVAARWQAGRHYKPLPEPVPTTVAAGKVEVIEVFWYGCGHCFALDPVLEQWKAGKPEYVEFTRVPVVWGPPHRQHAKLYYLAQALRRPELHAAIFDAIHKEGLMLADRDELTARAMQFAFFEAHGVTRQQFDAAYDSMTVAMNVQRAEAFTRQLSIDNVPQVFINGKYASSVGEAGGEAQLIALINDLAASEKR